MATGLQSTNSKTTAILRVAEFTTSGIAAPTASDAGVRVPALSKPGAPPLDATVRVYTTAGTGTLSIAYVRLWGRWEGETRWFPLGTGATADKGKLNQNTPGTVTALGETATDQLCHAEPFLYVGHCDYVFAEVNTVGGSDTEGVVDIVFPRGRE